MLRQRTALLKSLRAYPARAGRAARQSARAYAGTGGPQEAGQNGTGQDSAGAGGRAGLAGPAASTLDVWDEHLATAGAQLLAARIQLTASLRPLVARSYSAVSGGQKAEAAISYRQSLRTPSLSGPPGLGRPRSGRTGRARA